MMPDKRMFAGLAKRDAAREYPRTCPHRGDVIGMVDDHDLPPGIKLKQWQCAYLGVGVTWKDCAKCATESNFSECELKGSDKADG